METQLQDNIMSRMELNWLKNSTKVIPFNSVETKKLKSLSVPDSTRLENTSIGMGRVTLSLKKGKLDNKLLKDLELMKFKTQIIKLNLDLLKLAFYNLEADLQSLWFQDLGLISLRFNLARVLKLTCSEREE
jgi:hypothetical protein